MRILIASDLHGSLSSLHFLVQKAKELLLDMLVLLGDLVYHGPRNPLPDAYDTLSILHDFAELKALGTSFTAVKGNCDAEVDICHLPFPVTESAWIHCDGLHILASHGHRLPERPPLPDHLPQGTIILRGHTHIPRGETLQGFHFWNPGSLSLPKGGSKRSYGLYEQGTFQVWTMDGCKVLEHTPAHLS